MTKNKSVLLRFLLVVTCVFAISFMSGCTQNTQPAPQAPAGENETSQPVQVKVGSLKGPTSIGLVDFMQKAEDKETTNEFDFTVTGSPQELMAAFAKGDYDMALLPSNAASVLYNKTDGDVSVIDINTLGVLNVMTKDPSIKSMGDLAGHTIIMSGKGMTPEYVMRYLIKQNDLEGKVALDFRSEHTEVAASLQESEDAIAVLPQPFATAVNAKDPEIKYAIDLTEAWNKASNGDSKLVMGVTVVHNEFLKEHPEAVKEFIKEHKESCDQVKANPKAASQLIEKYGIMPKAKIAELAIPRCQIVCISGGEMQQDLAGYLQILYSANPKSVGGTLPTDDFYWKG